MTVHLCAWRRDGEQHTAGAVIAALLSSLGVEAVDPLVFGRALGEASTAGLSAGVALSAVALLGLVSEGVATREAHASDGHDGQLVGLGVRSGAGSAGQDGDRGSRTEKHCGGYRSVNSWIASRKNDSQD